MTSKGMALGTWCFMYDAVHQRGSEVLNQHKMTHGSVAGSRVAAVFDQPPYNIFYTLFLYTLISSFIANEEEKTDTAATIAKFSIEFNNLNGSNNGSNPPLWYQNVLLPCHNYNTPQHN